MDIRKVKKLIELMESSTLTELEIASGDESIKLKKAEANSQASTVKQSSVQSGGVIRASVAGTFHRSPSKNATAYVEEGTRISIGETIGLIEASTIMNKVTSSIAGNVHKFLVKDGDYVEIGEELVEIGP